MRGSVPGTVQGWVECLMQPARKGQIRHDESHSQIELPRGRLKRIFKFTKLLHAESRHFGAGDNGSLTLALDFVEDYEGRRDVLELPQTFGKLDGLSARSRKHRAGVTLMPSFAIGLVEFHSCRFQLLDERGKVGDLKPDIIQRSPAVCRARRTLGPLFEKTLCERISVLLGAVVGCEIELRAGNVKIDVGIGVRLTAEIGLIELVGKLSSPPVSL